MIIKRKSRLYILFLSFFVVLLWLVNCCEITECHTLTLRVADIPKHRLVLLLLQLLSAVVFVIETTDAPVEFVLTVVVAAAAVVPVVDVVEMTFPSPRKMTKPWAYRG